MLDIFEIYKQRGIPHNIKLEEFLDKYFHFLPMLDPSILDQMTAEEICDHHEFWNNDAYLPIKFLLENNKVSLSGFKTIMRTEYYYTNATDEKMEHMYQLLEDYIKDNKVDITEYFTETYLSEQIEDILRYKVRINTDVYLDNLNLEKALERSDSIAVLLFGFKNYDLPTRRVRMMEYICDNFELISKKFLCDGNSYKTSPSMYVRENCEFDSSPLIEVANYIEETHGVLNERFKNKVIIREYVRGLLKTSSYDKLKNFIELIKEEFPSIYKDVIQNKDFKNYFVAPKTLEIEGITLEKLHAFLDSCTELDRHRVTKNLEIYKAVNKDRFNYEYSKSKFFVEYTEEFLEYHLDESIRLYNLKLELAEKGEKEPITSHWRWNDFTQTIMRDIIHLCVEKNTWLNLIEKALSCKMYQEYLTWYVEANGALDILNYINIYQPHLIKDMNHKNLIEKIIVRQYNKAHY